MDKYEFNIKVEQIKKMTAKGDYETAMKIADGIDWRRVRNANLLSSIAEIYEQNGEYQEARDILMLAFERAPVGKRLLYKLSVISVEAGEIQDAEYYYRSFCDMNPDDSRQYLLRYMILKAKGAPAEQLINSLEQYASIDVDEKWLYELAVLYAQAGMEDECVRTCDKIMLLFGLGKYVDKAMELKLQYAPLNKQQMDLVENRDKYEEKLKRVEQSFDERDYYEDADVQPEEAASNVAETPVSAPQDLKPNAPSAAETPRVHTREVSESISLAKEQARALVSQAADASRRESSVAAQASPALETEQTAPSGAADVQTMQTDEEPSEQLYHMIIEAKTMEEGLAIAIDELKYFHEQYGISNKVAKTNAEKLNAKGFAVFVPKLSGKDLIIEQAGALQLSVVDEISDYIDGLKEVASVVLVDVIDHFDALAEARPQFIKKFDIVSDAEDEADDDDLFEDVDLDAAQPQESEAVVREAAGAKVQSQADEVITEPKAEQSYDDAPTYEEAPYEDADDGAAAYDDYAEDGYADASTDVYTDVPEEDDAVYEDENYEDEAYNDGGESAAYDTAYEDGAEEAYEEAPYEADADYSGEDYADNAAEEVTETLPDDYYTPMDTDEFATYAQRYAQRIDCVLSGKTVLALYEKIAMMEDDEIPLTKATAEELIEEAADKAEKPSLGKRLTGMFSSKYDKEGRLILREEHFV